MSSSADPIRGAFDTTLAARVERATRRIPREAQWRLLTMALIISDIVMTGIAFRLAYWVRFELSLPIFKVDVVPIFPFYRSISLVLMVSWVVIFRLNGLYERQHLLGGIQEYSRVFRAVSIGILLVIIIGFLEPSFILARGWLLGAWITTFFLVALGRFTMRRIVYRLRYRGYFLASTLIVGMNDEAKLLAEQLGSWQTSGLHVVGFVDPGEMPASSRRAPGQVPTLGRLDSLPRLLERYKIEELILATSALTREQMVSLFTEYGMLDGLSVRLSSGLFEIITTGLEVNELAYVPLVRVKKVRLTGFDLALKRLLDYCLTLPALLLLAPIMAIIALAIRLDSPGPAIYRRRVMGLNGKQFCAYKFRTMHVNGDEILRRYPELQKELARTYKLREDPRVTRVGALLRKYSLDELPQLLNVVKRDMSLVGPRMISPGEMEMYGQWGMNLLTVPPGITGLWQVSGRSDIAYDERVRLDMQYVRNWTIWSDLHLLLRTPVAVIRGRGAY